VVSSRISFLGVIGPVLTGIQAILVEVNSSIKAFVVKLLFASYILSQLLSLFSIKPAVFFDVGLILPRTNFYPCSINSEKERFHRKAWAVES
jgi:hypothetical protein